ncbi:MAG TPA: type II toxin-antitoxin system RelE/ParE family toxin [Armatimonadota bacterium]
MDIRFENRDLQDLYTGEKGASRFPSTVVDRFFELIAFIVASADERDFRAMKSLHFEKLLGKRQGSVSFRLNKQYRLIARLEEGHEAKTVVVLSIEDYH